MTENSKHTNKLLCLFSLVGTAIICWLYYQHIEHKQIYLEQQNHELKKHVKFLDKRLTQLEFSLKNHVPIPQEHLVSGDFSYFSSEPKVYFDSPTNSLPRIVSNGIFPIETSQLLTFENEGRKSGDMENTAVLIESTNRNDTERCINKLYAQRKSSKDLPIFLYTPTDISGIEYSLLREWKKIKPKVYSLRQTDIASAIQHVVNLYKKDYVISIKDHDHIGDDFTDFYFLGKRVLEMDQIIESVCGGSNELWQDQSMGDVFWLSQKTCETGSMISRRTLAADSASKTNISMRPEVARVGKAKKVTNDTWYLDHFDPAMIKKEGFEMRLEYDLGNAEKRSKNEWNQLKTSDDSSSIYMFPYENNDELKEYFEGADVEQLHKYKGIIPISTDRFKAYIVPIYTYEKRIVEDSFDS